MKDLKVVVFDADDTLWVNEPYFRDAEDYYLQLMQPYIPREQMERQLLDMIVANLPRYGYGIKAFMLSMTEAAIKATGGDLSPQVVGSILAIGKEMLDKPVELMPGVQQVLQSLQGQYRLVVATKGDLLDQERKLRKSGLLDCFHHVEIMSEKREGDYAKLLRHLDVRPEEFMMVGNSLKSDILPVLQLGGWAVHVPFYTTWVLEMVEHDDHLRHPSFRELSQIDQLLPLLQG